MAHDSHRRPIIAFQYRRRSEALFDGNQRHPSTAESPRFRSASTCDLAHFRRSEACGARRGPVLARRFQHETGRGIACSVLGGGPQMAVGVQGGGRSGVAEGALDGDDIASSCDQSGGKVVPKVMEPDPACRGPMARWISSRVAASGSGAAERASPACAAKAGHAAASPGPSRAVTSHMIERTSRDASWRSSCTVGVFTAVSHDDRRRASVRRVQVYDGAPMQVLWLRVRSFILRQNARSISFRDG